LNATGYFGRNGGSNWTASAECVGWSSGVGGRSEVEEETDECDDPENFVPGMWKYDNSTSSKPSISSSSELCSSLSSSLQFSIGDSDVDPRAAADCDITGKVIRGWVTSREVLSFVNPREVKPGCFGRVGGDEGCIGWNMSRAIVRPSSRLLIALRASSGSVERSRLMSEDSRTPELTKEVSRRSQGPEFQLTESKRPGCGDV